MYAHFQKYGISKQHCIMEYLVSKEYTAGKNGLGFFL